MLEESVTHPHCGLEGELLALTQLGRVEALVVLLKAEHTEGDVAGLVSHHVAQKLLQERICRHLGHEPEGGQRQSLHHDLHAEVGHIPPRVSDDVVEEHLQMGVDRVVTRALVVEVLGKYLHMPGLIHHLGGGVVLGIDPWDGLHDLGRAHQRTLLPVEELGQGPVLALHPELDPLLLRPFLSRSTGEVDSGGKPSGGHGVFDDQLLLIDIGVPGQIGLTIPLGLLGFLVELVEFGSGSLLIVPREDGVIDGVHCMSTIGVFGADHRQNRLEVVDVLSADDVVGAVHIDAHCTSPSECVVVVG